MKRVRLGLVVWVLACVAGPAQAQGGGQIGVALYGVAGRGTVVAVTNVPVGIQGELVVSFRGDPAAGCAAYGVCPYSGKVVVRPGSGSLAIVTDRVRGRIGHQATLVLNGFGTGLTTSARVQRSAPGGQGGTCADAKSSAFTAESSAVTRGHSITIRLLAPGGSLVETRCAGPHDGDLAGALPGVTLPVARAVRGRRSLDFTGTRTFAAHGFAGTITSSVVMRLGKAQPQPPSSSSPNFPPGIKTARIRTVTQRLSLVRVRGQLGALVRGTSDPIVCRLLDSCGLTGTLSLDRSARGVFAYVAASGPANRPYRDFLTALGLSHAGRARGIGVVAIVTVNGRVRASVSQAGAECTDSASSADATAIIVVAGSGSAFLVPTASGGLIGPWRTRCPGPDLEHAPGGVAGGLGPGGLGHRDLTLELRGKGSFQDDGYMVAPHGRLSVVVRRGRITQHVDVQPVD